MKPTNYVKPKENYVTVIPVDSAKVEEVSGVSPPGIIASVHGKEGFFKTQILVAMALIATLLLLVKIK